MGEPAWCPWAEQARTDPTAPDGDDRPSPVRSGTAFAVLAEFIREKVVWLPTLHPSVGFRFAGGWY